MFLNIEKLSFSYGHHEVIKDLSLNLNIGDILAIQGPSGSGKTTLLKSLLVNQILSQQYKLMELMS